MPTVTQTDCCTAARLLRSPLVLALAVTMANAAKPVMIDDTAYLAYARHIQQAPLDPYGFTIYWYSAPEPAFEVLAPPVVPYWLGLGMRLFGEHVAILKLTLFPFLWALAWSIRELLCRFARTDALLPLVVLSPAILPSVNLMLDVPALALGLASVALFARAADRQSWGLAIVSGAAAALAMQTKYTMLVIPPVLAWYAFTHRRAALAIAAIGVAVAAFVLWECLMVEQYERSHFLYHAALQRSGEPGLAATVFDKLDLSPGLAAHLGCLGIGAGLVAAGALGVKPRALVSAAAVWVCGFVLIAAIPYRWTLIGPAHDLAMIHWQFAGFLILAVLSASTAALLFRFRRRPRPRWNRDSLFLAGWFVIELAGYFVLTPFPAARRVIGIAVVGTLVAARLASRMSRAHHGRRSARWVLALGVGAGFLVAGIDFLDAAPEKVCAERAAEATARRPLTATVWFTGHWGFQYYCERAGMIPVVPGQSILRPGDFLVLPMHPDGQRFYRPHIGTAVPVPPSDRAIPVAEFVWDDPLSAQTVPNFYGGSVPIVGRDHPRLRVVIYRILRDWEYGRPRP